MATPSETEPKESKNQQAIASLVLGILSLALIFIIEVVGIVAGSLALYAGVRGLRFAKQFDVRGQIPAIAGMSLGVIGMIVNVLPFIAAFSDATQLGDNLRADATHTASLTSEAPQIYQGDGFTLTYQGDWQTLDTSQMEECQQSRLDCLLLIGHPSNDGTNIGVFLSELPFELDADEFYAMLTADWEATFPGAILEGPKLFEMNGLPAARVIVSMPLSSASEAGQILQLDS